MTREVKFRGWDGKNLLPALRTRLESDGRIWWSPDDGSVIGHNLYYDSSLYPLMQYTGEKDSNGKEIYEGDIIKFTSTGFGVGCGVAEWISPVVWDYASWMVWQKFDKDSGRGHTLGGIESDTFHQEVIGNIYENQQES